MLSRVECRINGTYNLSNVQRSPEIVEEIIVNTLLGRGFLVANTNISSGQLIGISLVLYVNFHKQLSLLSILHSW